MIDTPDIDPLTRLAIHHGTDKWAPHAYTPIYHKHFSHLRQRPIRVLEIGIGGYGSPQLGGNSLRMWADYFTKADVIGFDIEEKRIEPYPRVTTLRGSQDDPAFLTKLIADHGPFDIVIDDGSHLPKHMLTSFQMLFPALKEPGFYVIEDVQFAFSKLFGGSPAGAEPIQLANDIMLSINSSATPFGAPILALHSYRNLLIIERGRSAEPATQPYDLADPDVALAMSGAEFELGSTPTPDGLAHLARNYVRGRAHSKVLSTLRRGLAQWPDHFHLLVVGAQFAGRAGDQALRQHCAERLMAMAPNDPYVAKICRKVPSD